MYLTKNAIEKINKLLVDLFSSPDMPRYSLWDCCMNHLKRRDAIEKNGVVACGTINGAFLLKYMTREIYEFLLLFDEKFGILVDTNDNYGNRVKMMVCWKVDREVRLMMGPNNNVTAERTEKEWAGKQMTWEQFKKWQDEFEIKNRRSTSTFR